MEPFGSDQPELGQAWNCARVVLGDGFSFAEIKEIVGLAGLDLVRVSHLEQRSGGGASKGQLMTAIDRSFGELDQTRQGRFVAVVLEEVLQRRPGAREELEHKLSRLGWTLNGDVAMPVHIFDLSTLSELPSVSHADLRKAAQRLRDGDLSGAIGAACGAVDAATAEAYASGALGDPTKASFQERCVRALEATGVLPTLEGELEELGWNAQDSNMLAKNMKGTLNQGAYVMQALRSGMGDVHGTKPILRPLVFDCLELARMILRALG